MSGYVLWTATVETLPSSSSQPGRAWHQAVLASDCEHAAEVAARRFRREHGTWPVRVAVVDDHSRRWLCEIDYVRGGAVAVEGHGVRD